MSADEKTEPDSQLAAVRSIEAWLRESTSHELTLSRNLDGQIVARLLIYTPGAVGAQWVAPTALEALNGVAPAVGHLRLLAEGGAS